VILENQAGAEPGESKSRATPPAVERYIEMKSLLRSVIVDRKGKKLMLQTSKGMGERYLLRKYATQIGLAEIILEQAAQTDQFPPECLCWCGPEVSQTEISSLMETLHGGLIVFENLPRWLPSVLSSQGTASGKKIFRGAVLILLGEGDHFQAIPDSFIAFDLAVHEVEDVLDIAEYESASIADELSASGSFYSRSMVRFWISLARDVISNAAAAGEGSEPQVAKHVSLNLHQFLLILRLFPLIYPNQRDAMTRREWISENLGLRCPPFFSSDAMGEL